MPRDPLAVLRGLYLPESVALVVAGLVIGQLVPSARQLISADLVLFVFVPGLIFDAAFDLEWRVVRTLLPALVGLAGPGVLVSAAVVAAALSAVAGLPIALAALVGAITAATDPVAVVATLARLRMPDRLRTLIAGESLLNDGTGLVLVALVIAATLRGLDLAGGVVLFIVTVALSLLVGLGAGALAAVVLRASRHPLLAFVVSLAVAYATFAACAVAGLSGVLATVVAGAVLGNGLRRTWSDAHLAERLDRIWAIASYGLSALTFLSIGMAVDLAGLADDIVPIAVGVVALTAARALFVYVPSAFMRMPDGWSHVLFWSGLRGAIAFAAVLSLPAALPGRLTVQEVSFGIVIVTLIGQGLTAPLVVRVAMRGAPPED